jgi:hypothetical protein
MVTRDSTVIRLLFDHGELSGRELREKMNSERGWWFRHMTNSLAGFYYLMACMEDRGTVTSRDVPKLIEKQIIKERRFRLSVDAQHQMEWLTEDLKE